MNKVKRFLSGIVTLIFILNTGVYVFADAGEKNDVAAEIDIIDGEQYELTGDVSTLELGNDEFDISQWTIEDISFDEPQQLSDDDILVFDEMEPQTLSTSNYPDVILADMQHDKTDGYPDSPLPTNQKVGIMYRILNYGDVELQNIPIDYYSYYV